MIGRLGDRAKGVNMKRFNNDYNRAAHPRVIEALAGDEACHAGYGLDECCEHAEDLIRRRCDAPDAAVHFLVGGTQANATVIAAALRPYESVLCADTGHINVHETGAVEATGHKIQALSSVDGKIDADQVRAAGEEFRASSVPEHITEPAMVYVSFPTEYGTLYTRDELVQLRAACDEYGMSQFVDGARMSYGLAADGNDVTLSDFARLADVFTIGGTKCGALFGEAVVIVDEEIKSHFRSYVKRAGGMLAKGWLLGVQFCALLEDGLYLDIARRAVDQAMRIRSAFAEAGVAAYVDSPTNQQFVVVTDEQADELAKGYVYEPELRLPDGRQVVRFCTSWSTIDADVDALTADIARIAKLA